MVKRGVWIVGVLIGSVLVSTASAGAQGALPQTCGGESVTIYGTPGDDLLVGTDGADVIHGLQGNDQIIGLEGDDVICGGKGDDQLFGHQGFDVIYGAQGADLLFGNFGPLSDTAGSRMFGGAGPDFIFGTNRWDRMQGGPGDDVLFDGSMNGSGGGRDWMRGGPGNDILQSSGMDDIHGGRGSDFLEFNRATVNPSWGLDMCAVVPVPAPLSDEGLAPPAREPSNPDVGRCEGWVSLAGRADSWAPGSVWLPGDLRLSACLVSAHSADRFRSKCRELWTAPDNEAEAALRFDYGAILRVERFNGVDWVWFDRYSFGDLDGPQLLEEPRWELATDWHGGGNENPRLRTYRLAAGARTLEIPQQAFDSVCVDFNATYEFEDSSVSSLLAKSSAPLVSLSFNADHQVVLVRDQRGC